MTTTPTTASETSASRQRLYQQLMTITHRNYTPIVGEFATALHRDPDFTSRMMAYLAMGGTKIRDQVDAAIITLLQAPPQYPEYREAGRCLLVGSDVYDIEPDNIRGIDPFRIFRIEWHMRSPYAVQHNGATVARFPHEKYAQRALPKIARRLSTKDTTVDPSSLSVSHDNDHRKSPRLMASIMQDYLLMLENSPQRFDGVALDNRRAMKSAYKYHHIKMGKRAKSILIDEDYPADSKLAALRAIANSTNPREKLELVKQYKIGYRVLQSVLDSSTASRIILVEAMSPTEALNARSWMESSGLLSIPEVRDAYLAKVANATKSVASADHRKSAQGGDAEVQAAINTAKERSVRLAARIEGCTDIYIDKSYSMHAAIEVAPMFAQRLFPLCDDAAMFLFNDSAQEAKVVNTGNPLADTQTALRGTRAGGGTLFAKPFALSLHMGRRPQRIAMLTDGGDNRRGTDFVAAVQRYSSDTGIYPQFTMIHFDGDTDCITDKLQNAGYEIDKFHWEGDYYLLDQVTATMGGPPAMSLADKVAATVLPHRVI